MGRRIDSDEVMTGRNRDKVSGDSKFMRCSRCRFVIDTTKFQKLPEGSTAGWGMKYTEKTIYDDGDIAYDDISDQNYLYDGVSFDDPIVTGGCPNCGTFLYNK